MFEEIKKIYFFIIFKITPFLICFIFSFSIGYYLLEMNQNDNLKVVKRDNSKIQNKNLIK